MLSVCFGKVYDVLAQLNCGERHIKKMHLCWFLTLSYCFLEEMSVLPTYAIKCKETAEVKNSKEISLGIQEKCVNIIDCKSDSCKKTKSIFRFNLRSVNWWKYSYICRLYSYFGPLLTSSC